jgi:hypothetical protein
MDTARNLACHRAARSVWEKRGWSGVTIEERVGPWAVSLAGAALLAAGARRRSWKGAHLAIGGATLIACAAAGFCNPRHAAMRWRSHTERLPDPLTSELMDSFPASDPSSLTATTVGIIAVA